MPARPSDSLQPQPPVILYLYGKTLNECWQQTKPKHLEAKHHIKNVDINY